MLPVAILAGGLATRLLPLTERIPKSLVEVAGEPFVDHQLRSLRAHGIEHVTLCVGHLGELIVEHVGNGSAFGLRVTYSYDGGVPRGTAGALKGALPTLGDAFFVLYGDSYLRVDYVAVAERFRASGAEALMAVYRNDERWDVSNVAYENGKILAYDKRMRTSAMKYIDYGLGVLTPRALDDVPCDRPCDLADVYAALLARDNLAGFEVFERFYEIGSPSGLADTDALLRSMSGEQL